MRRKCGLMVPAIGLLVVMAGCRDPAGPAPILSNHRAVYAVIEVESPIVRVVAEEILDTGGRRPLVGAQGMVAGTSGSAPLTEAASGIGPCFVTDEPVMSGQEGCYGGLLPQPANALEAMILEMMLPDGTEIRGALVTPQRPLASIPADSQRVTSAFQNLPPDGLPIAIVPITLENAAGAQRVDVVTTVVRAFRFGAAGETIDPTGCEVEASVGTFREPPLQGTHDLSLYDVDCRENGQVVSWDSLDLAVHVISSEENYASYVNRVLGSSSLDASRASFGLDGAVGVFGAVATTALPLRVVFVP